eukprot:5999-Heterococcus_DN1.PRE.2
MASHKDGKSARFESLLSSMRVLLRSLTVVLARSTVHHTSRFPCCLSAPVRSEVHHSCSAHTMRMSSSSSTDPGLVTDLQTPQDVMKFWFDDAKKLEQDPELKAARLQLWFGGGDSNDFNAKQTASKALIDIAAAGGPEWTGSAEAVLSRLLVLDQFPRTAYRGSAESFVHEKLATQISNGAIDAGLDKVRYSASMQANALESDTRKMSCSLPQCGHVRCTALSVLALGPRSTSKWSDIEYYATANTLLLLCCALLLLLLLSSQTHTIGAHTKPAAVHLLSASAELNGQKQFAESHLAVVQQFGRFPHRNAILNRYTA